MSEILETDRKSGQCLCGTVKFEAQGPFRDVTACHCRQCARWSGHHVAATRVDANGLAIEDKTYLTWFQSSVEAKRGFCRKCGSSLFWQRLSGDKISIMAGVLDSPTGLHTARNIYLDDKSDYYQICDVDPDPGKERIR